MRIWGRLTGLAHPARELSVTGTQTFTMGGGPARMFPLFRREVDRLLEQSGAERGITVREGLI